MSELEQLRADLAILEKYRDRHGNFGCAVDETKAAIREIEAEQADPWREAKAYFDKQRERVKEDDIRILPLSDAAKHALAYHDHVVAENQRLAARVAELEAENKDFKGECSVLKRQHDHVFDDRERIKKRLAELEDVKGIADMQPPFEGPIVGFDMGKPGSDKTAIVIERTPRPHDRITMQRRIKMQRRELRRLNKSIDAGIWHTRYLVETLKQANARVAELEAEKRIVKNIDVVPLKPRDVSAEFADMDDDPELDPARVLATAVELGWGPTVYAEMTLLRDAKPYRLKGADDATR